MTVRCYPTSKGGRPIRPRIDWYQRGQEAGEEYDDMLRDARVVFHIICDINGVSKHGRQALDNYREFLRGWKGK